MHTQFLPFVTAALFVSGVVLAQSSAAPRSIPMEMRRASIPTASFGERFNTADRNGDHALSKAEAKDGQLTIIGRHFDEIDADKDGKVTMDEVRAYLARHVQPALMV